MSTKETSTSEDGRGGAAGLRINIPDYGISQGVPV